MFQLLNLLIKYGTSLCFVIHINIFYILEKRLRKNRNRCIMVLVIIKEK